MIHAVLMLIANSVLFFYLGRYTVIRGARWRMGNKVVDSIQEIIDRRPMIGDGMKITSTRIWQAYGYDWIMTIAQDSNRP